jgi:hypothetical protein
VPILVRRTGEKWQRADDVRFVAEAELQKMLYESPELVSQERPALFIREAGLPGSGYTDLLGVDCEGDILIVETKLARNPEVRRKVIGQILEYAAYLWTMSFGEFDEIFRAKEGKSIADLWREKNSEASDEFLENIKRNLQSGTFRLFIAVDEMNEHLEKIIAYVSSRGPGLKLQALELRTYKKGELEILAPQTHGDFVPTGPVASNAITIEQALANCPDEHARRLFRLLIDRWKVLGHEVKPGSVGIAFRADVDGSARSIFWASRGDLQAAFSEIQKYNAPPEAVEAFRSDLSRLKGFDSSKFLHDQQPIVKFAALTELQIESFVQAADALVRRWLATAGPTSPKPSADTV